MVAKSIFLLALATITLAQVPFGYRKVYITSKQDASFVVVAKSPVKAGTTTVVQPLNKKPEQQWLLKPGNTTIQLVDTTLCLDAGAKSKSDPVFTTKQNLTPSPANWKDMGSLYLQTCTNSTDAQKWNVMADGRIALAASSPAECMDLQYLRATAGNPVGLYACAGLQGIGAADKGINWPLVNVTV